MDAMACRASRWYSDTLAASVTGQMSSRWCGIPSRSAGVSLAVPMSMPRYSCMESALMISPPRVSARRSDRADFPAAVGPTTATTGWSDTGLRAGTARRHAEQDPLWRQPRFGYPCAGFAARARPACGAGRAGGPGIAAAGPPDAQRRLVGQQVVRRGAGDDGRDHVAGAGRGGVAGDGTGREVHQAVVRGAARHPVRGAVLAALAVGDQNNDLVAGQLLVLLPGDLRDQRGQPLVAIPDHLGRHLVVHLRGGRAGADGVLE